MIHIYSGITHGRMLNGELYTQRWQKFIYLYLSTHCFIKITLQILFKISFRGLEDWREIFIKQSVDKYR